MNSRSLAAELVARGPQTLAPPSFDGTFARMVKSRRINVPEISVKDAAVVQDAVPKFDNNKSYI